jgi:biopolymer transport protein ExbD
MAASAFTLNDQPLGELNTTPLIDVMLVLLVMFIISVPVTSHQLTFDLPSPAPVDPRTPVLPENLLSIEANGTITWNAAGVSEAQLVTLLKTSAALKPASLIKFEPSASAPYGQTMRVMNLVKATDPAAFAFSGNERYAEFGKAAPPQR